eukprot:13259828-Alexandrium_andersonii.AAC.1
MIGQDDRFPENFPGDGPEELNVHRHFGPAQASGNDLRDQLHDLITQVPLTPGEERRRSVLMLNLL